MLTRISQPARASRNGRRGLMGHVASAFASPILAISLVGCSPGSADPATTLAPIGSLPAGAVIGGTVRLGSTDAGIVDLVGRSIYPPDAEYAVKPPVAAGVHHMAYGGGPRTVAVLPFGDGPRLLVVVRPDPAESGGTMDATRVWVMEIDPGTAFGDGGGGYVATYTTDGCQVETGASRLDGTIACTLQGTGATVPTSDVIDVGAVWRVASVEDLVGRQFRVSWDLAGGYRSHGEDVVWESVGVDFAEGLRLPDVRVGGTFFDPELLRVVVRAAGDGAFEGDVVEPSLQRASGLIPRFGACSATVANGGMRGSVSCPGDASSGPAEHADSTSLQLTWRQP